MSELPQGVDPEIFEDLSISISGLGLCQVLQRPTELWEMVQLIRAERAMVRGEIYRWDGLRDAYRAAGIARTIVQKLNQIRERSGASIVSLRKFFQQVETAPKEPEALELTIAFITISQKGREAVARWVADPAGQLPDAATKIKAISGIVETYRRALREFKPVPPPPSSPLDKSERPQLQPRFQQVFPPIEGPLLPSGPPAAAPPPSPSAPAPAPSPAPAQVAATAPVAAPAPKPAPAPVPAAAMDKSGTLRPSESVSPVTLILPRGVNPEILEDVQRVDQCRRIFEETHQEIEVWEVFCLVMLDGDATRGALEKLTALKQGGDQKAFVEGAMQLFERLLKVRAQHGKFVRDLRVFLATLPIGTFGKETMEMALGFIIASPRGRDRAQLWLTEPGRYKQEAAGRLEDVVSRTMNYQTALRMVNPS
jgi:hypothetical protein